VLACAARRRSHMGGTKHVYNAVFGRAAGLASRGADMTHRFPRRASRSRSIEDATQVRDVDGSWNTGACDGAGVTHFAGLRAKPWDAAAPDTPCVAKWRAALAEARRAGWG